MPVLTPNQTIDAAVGIYGILKTDQLHDYFGAEIRNNFNIKNSTRYTGKSGFTLWQTESGFALAAMGYNTRESSDYKDDALITIRGTKKLIDWITDAHAGYGMINGKLVHSGFKKVFTSFENDLREFFNHRDHNPRRVHCVGHSLGGAIATIVADWVSHNTTATPYLYTYGSPRVGSQNFADKFTHNIKPENIFRVYHKNDPVSMVPLWPFIHVPVHGNNYGVNFAGSDSAISFSAHFKENYTASASGKTWESLLSLPLSPKSESEIKRWLKSLPVVGMNFSTMFMLQEAIIYILKKALLLTGISIQFLLATGISSVLDIIAYVLAKAWAVGKEIKSQISSLLQKIASLLGLVVDTTKDISLSILRFVFEKLYQALSNMAKQALRGTLI